MRVNIKIDLVGSTRVVARSVKAVREVTGKEVAFIQWHTTGPARQPVEKGNYLENRRQPIQETVPKQTQER